MKEYFSLHYLLPSSPTAILTKNVSYFYMKIAGVIFQIDFNSLSQLAKKKEKRAFLVLFFLQTHQFILTAGSLHLCSVLSQKFLILPYPQFSLAVSFLSLGIPLKPI